MGSTHREESSKSVGIWIRVSTEDQVRGESPEHHHKRAAAYAEAKGWQVAEVYRLEAVSGKAVMAHPEAQRMLADVRAGRISGLVFSKLARLARNTRELLDFAEIFRTEGADLVSLQEAIDTSSPAGRLFFTMIAAMAQWEREEIAERVAASVPVRAKLGKPIGGAAPFGYRWLDKKLVPHPEEAPIRVLIYELFRDHRRKKTVARLLNERGHRTRNGSEFSDTTITRLLLDPTAKGLYRQNYTTTNDRTKSWALKPESEWVHNQVEPIVSEVLWEECAAIITAQRRQPKPMTKKAVQLFAGFTFCACGTKMYVPSNSPKYICHSCRNKIPVADLEAIFHEQLRNFVFSPEEIARYLSEGDADLKKREELLSVLQGEERKVTAEADKLYDLYQAGAIDKDGFGSRYQRIGKRLKQLGDEIPRAQAEIDAVRISFLSQEEIIREAQDLYTRWPTLPREEQRQIVEAIVERITVHDGEVEIDLFFNPAPGDLPEPGNGGVPAPSSLTDGSLATRRHGFIAATSCTRAGKATWALALATVTSPVSSGWRSESSTARWNSGSSSRNRTPRWARLTSPGRTRRPPPTSAAMDAL
jgi:site-specific DNA recombinase